MLKTIIFDMGGVIFSLGYEQAVGRFRELGLKDAENYLDPAVQFGMFGDLEAGKISCGEFRRGLQELTGSEITLEQCEYAWKGYILALPGRNLDKLVELRRRGCRLLLLSNTNPFITAWAHSPAFSAASDGKWAETSLPMDAFFDRLYFSCDLKLMKPSEDIFLKVLELEGLKAGDCLFVDDSPLNIATAAGLGFKTLRPENNSDWTAVIDSCL